MRRVDVPRRVDDYGCRISDREVLLSEKFVRHCAQPGFGYGVVSYDDDVKRLLAELEKAKRRHSRALWSLVRRLEPEERRRFLSGAKCLQRKSRVYGSVSVFLCDTIDWLCRERERVKALLEFLNEPGVL